MRTREQVYERLNDNFEGIKQASSFADKESMLSRSYLVEILETLLDIRELLVEANKPKQQHHEFNINQTDN